MVGTTSRGDESGHAPGEQVEASEQIATGRVEVVHAGTTRLLHPFRRCPTLHGRRLADPRAAANGVQAIQPGTVRDPFAHRDGVALPTRATNDSLMTSRPAARRGALTAHPA
ncbi:hypothetical protein GCM10023317_70820 [Actinopolymorpha pittospori]